MSDKRKRALILYDVPGWAQHRFACGIRSHAPDWCEVDVGIAGEYLNGGIDADRIAQYDGVLAPLFAMYRRSGVRRLVGLLASHALMFSRYDKDDWRTLGVTKDRHRRHAANVLQNVDGAIARNRELRFSLSEYHDHIVTIPVGVDLSVFNNTGRHYSKSGEPLRIGWCGNKACKLDRNFKGYERILQPLMRRTGGRYEWHVNTNSHKEAIPPEGMAKWYRACDVFITTASAEGTPNPAYEAAACGCCVISTDVGGITDWVAMRSLAQIVPTYRNKEEAAVTIRAFEQLLHGFDKKRELVEQAGGILAHDVGRRYSYRVLAPGILQFVTLHEGKQRP